MIAVCSLCEKEGETGAFGVDLPAGWREGEYGPECQDHPEPETSDRSPDIFNEIAADMADYIVIKQVDVLKLIDAAATLAEEDGVSYASSGLTALRERVTQLKTFTAATKEENPNNG